eukprot:6495600-Pyramimonas_sp.AAC.1
MALGSLLLDPEVFEYNTLDLPDPRWAQHLGELMWFSVGKDVRGSTDNAGAAASEPQDVWHCQNIGGGEDAEDG